MSIGGLVAAGPLLLAIPVAAAAGAVTFLSPCVLPLVPGYLSYITGMSGSAAQAEPEREPELSQSQRQRWLSRPRPPPARLSPLPRRLPLRPPPRSGPRDRAP